MHGKLVYFKLIFVLCFGIQVGQAQITNVNSAIKVIGGDVFYQHTVLEGQSLSAIAAAYFSDVSSIEKNNPGLSNPPATGTKIKIPYTDESAEAMSKDATQVSIPKAQPVYLKSEDIEPEPEPIKEVVVQLTPMEEAISLLNKSKKGGAVVPTAPPVKNTASIPAKQPEVKPAVTAPPKVEKPAPVAKPAVPNPEAVKVVEPAPITPAKTEPKVVAREPEVIQKPIEPAEPAKPVEPAKEELAIIEPIEIEEIPEEASPETKKALANLNELSKNINESLENLAKIQAALDEPSAVDPETGELIVEAPTTPLLSANELMASSLLEQQFVNFFDTASKRKFELKEFFVADLNPAHQIVKLKDERTVTNQNSKYLSVAELMGVTIDSLSSTDKRLALGFVVEMTRHEYLVKVKGKKVRVYQTPVYVEHFPEGHPFAALILEAASNSGQRGKGRVVILDGYEEINSYKAFEYNPFGTLDKTIMRKTISRIDQMDF